jgi:hypothetical protein
MGSHGSIGGVEEPAKIPHETASWGGAGWLNIAVSGAALLAGAARPG